MLGSCKPPHSHQGTCGDADASEHSGAHGITTRAKSSPSGSQVATMERPTPQLDLASSRNFAVLVVFLFGLFALRRPDAVLHAQFWAEDGTIIFRDQLVSGFMAALRTPYRGFFPLSARLVAGPLSLFPAYYSPLLYNATGIAIASISAGLFFLPRYRVFLRSDLLRLVLCVFAVAAFHTTELVGSLTNSMWYLTLPAILLVLLPPRLDPRSASVTTLGYSSVAAILGASSPITVAAFPIALYKAGRDFSRGGLISLAAVGGAA